jgi:hypothetical protein
MAPYHTPADALIQTHRFGLLVIAIAAEFVVTENLKSIQSHFEAGIIGSLPCYHQNWQQSSLPTSVIEVVSRKHYLDGCDHASRMA